MIRTLLIALAFIITSQLLCGYSIKALYAVPTGDSKIAAYGPEFFSIDVRDHKYYSNGNWYLINAKLNWVISGQWSGWIFIPKEVK